MLKRLLENFALNRLSLFHRAIIQSGSVQCIRDKHTAMELAKIVLEKLGVAKTPANILYKSGEEIIAAQEAAYDVIDKAHLFGLVVDGSTIMERPEKYIKSTARKINIYPIGSPILLMRLDTGCIWIKKCIWNNLI